MLQIGEIKLMIQILVIKVVSHYTGLCTLAIHEKPGMLLDDKI